MADDERCGSLADAELPSANTVTAALRCRSKTSVYLFLSHITSIASYYSQKYSIFYKIFWEKKVL